MDFKEHIMSLLGEEKFKKLIDSFAEKPFSAIRINTSKFDINSDAYQIFTSKFKKHSIVENAFYINEKMGNHPYHMAGAFYIQEPSAMLVGELIPIENNDMVIDVCASPGGKSSHIANKLSQNGLLVSNEISYPRAKILSENIERQGIKNCVVLNENIDNLLCFYAGTFDKVILDAPCSGEGMFRKNDLVKNDWSYEKVIKCSRLQKELILKSYKLLRKNGLMIYSTCTFSKEENEEVINYLLENTRASLINIKSINNTNRGINMQEALRIFPFNFQGEGHFISLIMCNDNNVNINTKYHLNKKISSQTLKLIDSFCKDNLTYNFDYKRIYIKNDDIYYLPEKIINFRDLKHLRVGQHIGKILKNRIEPSHSFAMSSKKEDFQRIINFTLDDKLLTKFLHGETFKVDLKNGYCLVLVDGMSIGHGKVVNNIFKNLFPKGLRK
ncbi:MAG: RsmB/NOP family class I SAM-dependent RNA methyltransferase [Bacilli bacterium]|nr:RsmB/NOP family class I SAM-dependent RNA methyltransferase [Bacilli bacterium]